MIALTRIDHVNMRVKDLAASERFYGELFGFEAKERGVRGGAPWAILGVPGRAYLCLYEAPAAERADESLSIRHFGFHVEDFERVEKELRAKGVEVSYGGAVEQGASRSLYIEDPSGHEIELAEMAGGGLS